MSVQIPVLSGTDKSSATVCAKQTVTKDIPTESSMRAKSRAAKSGKARAQVTTLF